MKQQTWNNLIGVILIKLKYISKSSVRHSHTPIKSFKFFNTNVQRSQLILSNDKTYLIARTKTSQILGMVLPFMQNKLLLLHTNNKLIFRFLSAGQYIF